MAPLPDNATGRYFVDYAVDGMSHTLMARFQSPNAVESVRFHVEQFLNALQPIMAADWAITGARLSSQGSTFSVPTPPPVLAAPPAGPNLPDVNRPQFTSFIGRGVETGRRVRVFVYGLVLTIDSDFRLQLPLPAAIGAAIADLEAAQDDGVFVTIGNDRANWYDYVNQGFNAYWQREARTS